MGIFTDEGKIGFGGNPSGVLNSGFRRNNKTQGRRFAQSFEGMYDATGRMISSNEDNVDFYKHYKTGSGKAVYNQGVMKNSSMISEAVKTNRDRFEQSMVDGEVKQKYGKVINHAFKDQILGLKDGESTTLNAPNSPGGGDYWDRDIGRYEGALKGDIKQSLGLGGVKLCSTGLFKATRSGDEVNIDGVVDHRINDVYNFNDDDPEFSRFRDMEKNGKAKSFSVHGSALERLRGKLIVKDGHVKDHDFKWTPINRKDLR